MGLSFLFIYLIYKKLRSWQLWKYCDKNIFIEFCSPID